MRFKYSRYGYAIILLVITLLLNANRAQLTPENKHLTFCEQIKGWIYQGDGCKYQQAFREYKNKNKEHNNICMMINQRGFNGLLKAILINWNILL